MRPLHTDVMRIQFFYNSPKARRYFRALRDGLTQDSVALAPIGLASAPPLADTEVAWMTHYSLARKAARPHLSEARIRQHTQVLRRFARWHYGAVLQRMQAMRPEVVGVWGGQGVDTRAVRAAAAALGIPCVLFETGLLPSTTTADARGVNFENAVPRDPRFYARYTATAALPQQFVPRRQPEGEAEPLPERYVFVPFQVALDSQVLLYSPWIRSMAQLYWLMESCLREVPEPLHLVCKPHPSCNLAHTELRRHAHGHARIHMVDNHSSEALIRGAEGVVTLNSSVGIEALLLDRPVLCLGDACYAVPGVAARARAPEPIRQWLTDVAAGHAPEAPLRLPFLHWLANEYVIPDSHKAPGAAHFVRLRARLAAAAERTRYGYPHWAAAA
ncbi:hypothetical protein KHP57_07800 [Algiphilus sp. NNCM1]|uniref:capsular polysaccharide export protein, LipB/KpsS family n=1 Tax=Algiphilus sp. TaxID=1872431 RepID=UPI0025C0E887|nr:hypothetical protein [Algiphilus sp.]MBY8965608.1 hypothetical protein [Algiphilus acroporae]MCI5063590.1 hypothetical protein [Algiphilus sp.]MCI5104651.1 hypothetical protein [Algiphilus sp.]